MKKVEILSDQDYKVLQQEVNDFIKDKVVCSIEFQAIINDFSVMIVYMEKRNFDEIINSDKVIKTEPIKNKYLI